MSKNLTYKGPSGAKFRVKKIMVPRYAIVAMHGNKIISVCDDVTYITREKAESVMSQVAEDEGWEKL